MRCARQCCVEKTVFHTWFFVWAVLQKGVEHLWCSRACASMLSRAGSGRVVIRSDTDNSRAEDKQYSSLQ